MSQRSQKKTLRHRKKKRSLPLILFFAGGLLLVIGAFFAFKKSTEPNAAIEIIGAPSLKVDQEKVDLGNIKLGRTIDVKFKLTNVGDETLRFSKAPYIEVLEGC